MTATNEPDPVGAMLESIRESMERLADAAARLNAQAAARDELLAMREAVNG